jgi:hypothetical protein
MRGGVLGKKEIIIPINHQNTHWLCLKASIERKSIELWDSMGRNDSNQSYLNSMKGYLKDKYQETFPAEDADDGYPSGPCRTILTTPPGNTTDTIVASSPLST